MSKEIFKKALEFVYPSEGGYVNNSYDLGGPTNMGITQKTYDNYRKSEGLQIKDVKHITKDEATDIYYKNYWKPAGVDDISDPNMAIIVFDTAVLHGPAKAKEFYKKSNGDLEKYLDIRKKKL